MTDSTKGRRRCSALGCQQYVEEGNHWSDLCHKHAARKYRTGTAGANPMVKGDLKKYREQIDRTLDRYACSKAVHAAVLIADDYLHWRPRSDFTNHYTLADQMKRLRTHARPTTAREFLQRSCEVWALQAFDQRFDTTELLAISMARGVLMLRGQGTFRPGRPLLRLLGDQLVEDLGKFCAGVCLKIEADHQMRVNAKRAFESWAIAGQPGSLPKPAQGRAG